ncbi:phosphodiester glycosidase family protein [Streptomyces sp. NPDC006458]|uniref:phosphodiester glycosidase family protein n=1 Tax=Streptomyces sp. NPDC006458 TaxID=3154302 RepID=UPI0033B1EDE6
MSNRMARRGLIGGAITVALVAGTMATSVATQSDKEQMSGTGGRPARPASQPAAAAAATAKLPLGPASLPETRTTRQIAPGLTHMAIERGRASADDYWTVTVGFGRTEVELTEVEARVRAAGYEPRRDRTAGPDPRGPLDQPLGWAVRVGRYATHDAAGRVKHEMAAKGLTANVQHTSEDGHATTGPWSVDVLIVDPARFRGRLRSEVANGIVPGRETTSSMARRTGALAAVNGGFFVIGSGKTTPGNWLAGTDGDLGGIAVSGGDLVSEAANDRPALIVPTASGKGTSVRRLRTKVTVRSTDGATRLVTGLNRQSGLIVNCGGVGTATPFSHPAQDYTCGNKNELVAVTPKFGKSAPEGSGYQVTLDAAGRVTAVRTSRGGAVPARGTVLQGTGSAVQWLRTHARVGATLTLNRAVTDAETGARVPLTSQTSIVNGAPLLLRNNRTVLNPVRDGWSPEAIQGAERASLYNAWYLRRNPRTAAGTTVDGRIVLLTVDGRDPGRSAGLTIPETASVMRSLGAVNAVNLDGGGSTAMVVGNKLQGRPSDTTGERPDGDALVILPG